MADAVQFVEWHIGIQLLKWDVADASHLRVEVVGTFNRRSNADAAVLQISEACLK